MNPLPPALRLVCQAIDEILNVLDPIDDSRDVAAAEALADAEAQIEAWEPGKFAEIDAVLDTLDKQLVVLRDLIATGRDEYRPGETSASLDSAPSPGHPHYRLDPTT